MGTNMQYKISIIIILNVCITMVDMRYLLVKTKGKKMDTDFKSDNEVGTDYSDNEGPKRYEKKKENEEVKGYESIKTENNEPKGYGTTKLENEEPKGYGAIKTENDEPKGKGTTEPEYEEPKGYETTRKENDEPKGKEPQPKGYGGKKT